MIRVQSLVVFLIFFLFFFLPFQALSQCISPQTGITNWWGGDNNALDIVGTHDGTLNGDTAYIAGEVGEAFSVDGSGDFVTLPVSTDWDFGTGSFTISAWFKTSMSGSLGNIIRYHNGGGGTGYWGLRMYTNNRIDFFIANVTGAQSRIESISTYNDDSWHFVTAVRDGGQLRLYIDGSEAAAPVSDGNSNVVATVGTYPTIGALGMLPGEYFNGLIDEVQIFSRGLSLVEHQNTYNAGIDGNCRPCESQQVGAVSWWRGEDSGADSVGTNDGTLINGVTFAEGKVAQALNFDGTNDYVVVNDVSFPSGNAVRTITLWAKTNQTGEHYLFSYGSNTSNQRFSLGVRNGYLYVENTGSGLSGDVIINDNEWHHLAAVWNGSALALYVDGLIQVLTEPVGPFPGTLETVLNGSANMGRVNAVDGYYYNGLIDETVIYNSALTADEVAALYNGGSTGICGSCVDEPSGLVAWWGGDGNGADLVGSNNGTPVSGATYTDGKVGQAFSFDGTNDYVDIPPETSLLLNDTSGSIMAWVKQSEVGGNDIIVAFGGNSPGETVGLGIFGNVRIFHYSGAYDWQTTTPVTANEWTFLAYTWDATTERIYKNGEFSESRPRNFSYNPNPVNARIGHGWWGDSANAFPGQIDEIQIFDRTLTPEQIAELYNADSNGLCRTCADRPAGMVSWWRGQGNAIDYMGSNNGSLMNSTTYAPGMVGQSFDFEDSTNDYVEVPHSASLDITGAFSAEGWVQLDTIRQSTMFTKSDNNGTAAISSYILSPNDDGTINVTMYGSYPADTHKSSASLLTTGTWYHVAVTWDGITTNTDNLKLYVDGTLAQTWTKSSSLNSTPQNLTIGAMKPPTYYRKTDGRIDELAIYNRELTASEIASIANARNSGKCTCVFSTFYRDADLDTYGDPGVSVEACSAPTGYVSNNGDCDDTKSNVKPGGTEICDGLDNDCNSTADDNLTAPANSMQDGVCNGSVQTCSGVGGWIDDYSGIATYEAGNETTCDGLDNDCDGTADDNLTASANSLQDGVCSGSVQTCSGIGGWIDDYSGIATYEAVNETTCDGLDNDCDGTADDNLTASANSLQDGVCSGSVQTCSGVGGWVDDYSGIATYEAGTETTCDGLDNDCDGIADDNLTASANSLQDGVCSGSVQTCSGVGGWIDDYSGIATYEAGNETTCDGLDNDCNGSIDENRVCRGSFWLLILPSILSGGGTGQ